MKLGLGPRSGEIHLQLERAGQAVLAVAIDVDRRFKQWPSGPSQDEIKELEHVADRIVSELLSMTNSMFVTPYDRDDLTTLAFKIDDVADAAENASELLGLYNIETPTRQSFELCDILVQATEELALLLGGLRDARGASLRVIAIKELEDRSDAIARAARASLFKDDRIDPGIVIRWKDIYNALEDAIDACDTAASRIGGILVKNA